MAERFAIEQLTAADFQDAIDFLNLVFGAHCPHDFLNLLPVCYRPTDRHMATQYAIRKEGRIRAIVGMFPLQWQILDRTLKVAGIGGVLTHPGWRNSGMMQALMNHCVNVMKHEGYHLSWLGGNRQRYQHFGYERCGTMLSWGLNKLNVRAHAAKIADIEFQPLTSDDTAFLARARKLHAAQPVHAVRATDDFYLNLLSWYHRPYVALDAKGRMLGYLVANSSRDLIPEACAANDDTLFHILCAWVQQRQNGEHAAIELPALGRRLQVLLSENAEHVQVNPSSNWLIFDWENVLNALLKLKWQLAGPLLPGTVVLEIADAGTFALNVCANRAGCERTKTKPHLRLHSFAAMRLLFGPLPPALVMPLPAAAAPLTSWCPLPVSWPRQDGV